MASRRQLPLHFMSRGDEPLKGTREASSYMGIEKQPGRLGALTGLRFIAASLIVIEHSATFGLQLPRFGYDHGVSFFFVLSGFILSYVHPKIEGRREAVMFILYRIARIWPAHVIVLLATILILNNEITSALLPNLTLVMLGSL